ncbi:MAG: phosphate regulon sensor histidine kinase PhoR [Lysobacterales bacterium]
MPPRSWKIHAAAVAAMIAAALVVGLVSGFPFQVLSAMLFVYMGWLLFNIWRLHDWLGDSRSEPPDADGIWREMYSAISTLEQRNTFQRQRFEAMISDFRGLAEAFPDAALVIDGADNITWFNSSAQKLLHLKAPGDLGRPLINLIRDPDFANWLAVQPGVKSPLELQSPRSDNQWLNASAVPIRDGQRLIVLRDITEVHIVEQIRRDFVANISHELRTPLTVLQGYLEMLANHSSSEVSMSVQKMLVQTAHMQSMLDDLLELSRLQSDTLDEEEKRVDLPAMLMQLKEQAEEISRGRQELEFNVEHDLWLNGAAADLESAISNLIGNAIKYSEDGGRIIVTWKRSPDGPQLIVADEGIGIPKRDIPRITERFYRVGSDRARQGSGGTGLGLAIVKHVMNAHQATLSIESELGEGSVFTCTFPEERARYKKDNPA